MDSSPDLRFRRHFVLALTVAFGLGFLALIAGFLDALLLAAVFSVFIHPLYRWFESRVGDRRNLASALTLLVAVTLILVPFILLLALVADQAGEVAAKAAPWVEEEWRLMTSEGLRLPSWLPFAAELEPYTEAIAAKLAEAARAIGAYLAEGLAKLSQGTVSFFFSLFIMIYATYTFLIHGPEMLESALAHVPLSSRERRESLDMGRSVIRATIKGGLVIGIIQGALGGVGFAIAGLDAPVFWGAVMIVLSLLPVVGASLIWIPAAIYLVADGQVWMGVGMVLWGALVINSVDNFLRPVLVGRDLKMPDLLILISTLGGLAVFGPAGLVLGPLLAAAFITVLAIYRRVFAAELAVEESEEPPAEKDSR